MAQVARGVATVMLRYASYLEVIGSEVARILDLVADGRDDLIADCAPWRVSELVAHLVELCSEWNLQLQNADDLHYLSAPRELRRLVSPNDLERETDQLLMMLERVGEEAPCWNWTGEDLQAIWVARRVAVEMTLHRCDLERARGAYTEIDDVMGIDGIDERLESRLPVSLRANPTATTRGSICFVAHPAGRAWNVSPERGRLRLRDGRGPAAVVLEGGVGALLQFLWNRIDLDAFVVTGNREVALAWRSLPCP